MRGCFKKLVDHSASCTAIHGEHRHNNGQNHRPNRRDNIKRDEEQRNKDHRHQDSLPHSDPSKPAGAALGRPPARGAVRLFQSRATAHRYSRTRHRRTATAESWRCAPLRWAGLPNPGRDTRGIEIAGEVRLAQSLRAAFALSAVPGKGPGSPHNLVSVPRS